MANDAQICEVLHNVGLDKKIRWICHCILMTVRVGMNCILTQPPFCVKYRQANFVSVNSTNSLISRRYQILLTDIRFEAT